MELPQFLYIPRVSAENPAGLIHEKDKQVYWQVFEFANHEALMDWYTENEQAFKSGGYLAFAAHKDYPIALLCLAAKTSIALDALVELGEQASDWYAQFYLRNKTLSRPAFAPDDAGLEKAAKHFYNWCWGDNHTREDKPNYLINLEEGVSIKFDYEENTFASFEDFETHIADVQFLSGHRPSEEEVERIVTDAWNYLAIEERLLDGFGEEDIDDAIF